MNYDTFEGSHRIDTVLFSDMYIHLTCQDDLELFKWYRIFSATLIDPGHSLQKSINLFIPKNH